MILYHATPKRNLESIRKDGLQPTRAAGRIKGIWLHTKSKQPWAILHTLKRHQLQSFDEVILLEVSIPRSQLTRRWRGLWTCDSVIRTFTEIEINGITDSPLED